MIQYEEISVSCLRRGLLTACDKDKNQQTSVLYGGAISIEEAVISPVGSEVSFAVTTDAAWKVYDKPDWLNLSKTEGRSGTTSLVMSAEMNRTYENRDCTIRFETVDGNFSELLPVSQEYPYVELSREEITFKWNQCETFETVAETIDLRCNTDWTLTRELANRVRKAGGKCGGTLRRIFPAVPHRRCRNGRMDGLLGFGRERERRAVV